MPEEDGAGQQAPGGSRPRGRRRRRAGGAASAGGPSPGRAAGTGSRRPGDYWMIVTSPENLRRTRERGFAAQGLKRAHRKRVERMHPGDRVLYYVTGRMAFAAVATVTSGMYEDHELIWRSARREEDYPWRVRVRGDIVLEEGGWMPAREIAYRMDYVRKWPPEHWTLAFQGQLHQLPRKDFELVEEEMRKATARAPAAS